MKGFIILISVIFWGCNNHSLQSEAAKKEVTDSLSKVDSLLPRKISIEKDTFILHPTGVKSISAFLDTTINGIGFNDCETISKLFGDSYKLLPDTDDLPSLQILNNDGTQLLTMYMWNGNSQCDFSQFQIEYSSKNLKYIQKPFTLPAMTFTSGRKIELGITINALKSLIGQPSEVKTAKNLKVLSYQEYNGLYFADYYFKGDKLVKFRFGEEYP